MESAVVMHGEEGLGKNFFWDVVSRIYRDYATVITQNELESQFNTWSSRKLFMVANEVVSRSELREHKGRLKNYITERELQINEKLLPLRTERNHMNFVFLSNETQPLALDRTDRRYLVIWTPRRGPARRVLQGCRAVRSMAAEPLGCMHTSSPWISATSMSTPSRSSPRRSATSSRSPRRRRSSSSTSGRRACCRCDSFRRSPPISTAHSRSGAR
jgi:hypothetical protein